jgi:hypothetical protein
VRKENLFIISRIYQEISKVYHLFYTQSSKFTPACGRQERHFTKLVSGTKKISFKEEAFCRKTTKYFVLVDTVPICMSQLVVQ